MIVAADEALSPAELEVPSESQTTPTTTKAPLPTNIVDIEKRDPLVTVTEAPERTVLLIPPQVTVFKTEVKTVVETEAKTLDEAKPVFEQPGIGQIPDPLVSGRWNPFTEAEFLAQAYGGPTVLSDECKSGCPYTIWTINTSGEAPVTAAEGVPTNAALPGDSLPTADAAKVRRAEPAATTTLKSQESEPASKTVTPTITPPTVTAVVTPNVARSITDEEKAAATPILQRRDRFPYPSFEAPPPVISASPVSSAVVGIATGCARQEGNALQKRDKVPKPFPYPAFEAPPAVSGTPALEAPPAVSEAPAPDDKAADCPEEQIKPRQATGCTYKWPDPECTPEKDCSGPCEGVLNDAEHDSYG